MDERLAAATRDCFAAPLAGWEDFQQGQEAVRAAEQLGESDESDTGSLLLHRAAAALLARAHLARAGVEPAHAVAANEDWGRLAELLGQDGATVERHGHGPRHEGWSEFELGREAVRAAEKLRESGGPEASALLLHRTAAVLFVRAHLAQSPGALGPVAVGEQDWERLAQLPRVSPLLQSLSEDQRRLVAASLGARGESHLATLSGDERRAAARLLGRVARGLAAPLAAEARRVARVLLVRWLRIGIAAVALVGLVTYGVISSGALGERNLALHRPVVMSSVYSGDVGHDPSLLVDGDRTNLGFHTERGGHQHVTIDLGAVQSVSKVVVYNRTDCCGSKAVPLRVEVSEDGNAYQQVAMREKNFKVWKATFSSVQARYVRLTSLRGDYFHLAEVEVY
jgi:hypothetical protein